MSRLWVGPVGHREAKTECPGILHHVDDPHAVIYRTAQKPDTEGSWPAEIPFPNARLKLIEPNEWRQVFSPFNDLACHADRVAGAGGVDFVKCNLSSPFSDEGCLTPIRELNPTGFHFAHWKWAAARWDLTCAQTNESTGGDWLRECQYRSHQHKSVCEPQAHVVLDPAFVRWALRGCKTVSRCGKGRTSVPSVPDVPVSGDGVADAKAAGASTPTGGLLTRCLIVSGAILG
jgi:hypothetical protein